MAVSRLVALVAMIPPQRQMTGMIGQPVHAHFWLPWQFWKKDIGIPGR